MLCNVERCEAKRKISMKIDSYREWRHEPSTKGIFWERQLYPEGHQMKLPINWPWHRDS